MKTLFNALAVLTFALAPHTAAQEKPVKPESGAATPASTGAKTGATAYDDFPEEWRKRFVKDWEEKASAVKEAAAERVAAAKERVTAAEESLKTSTAKARSGKVVTAQEAQRLTKQVKQDKASLESAKTRVRDVEARLSKAEEKQNDPPYFKAFPSFESCRVGGYGKCGFNPEIFQVIDGKRVLVKSQGSTIVVLTLLTTAGLVDGRNIVLTDKLLNVTGTTTYKTAIGGTKTVFTVEVLDLDSLKK
jgi:hypothetical protein